MTTIAEKALEIAAGLTNVREVPLGSNRGPEVDQYLRNVGLEPIGHAYSWCMAFQYWIFSQAAKALGVQNPLYKTAGVLKQWQQRASKRVATGAAQSGDIGIIIHPDGVSGHTFIVESIDAEGIHTIEGNTNTDGSSNGIGVFRLTRHPDQVSMKGYLRF